MKRNRMIALIAIALLAAASAASALEVPLTVTERAGVDRVDNHVNSGVPLPAGAVKEVAELGLFTEDGKPVNAQIVERVRWLSDNSLKFVTVHFTTDLAAKGTKKYVLKTAKAQPAATLKIEKGDGTVTVDTGPIRFTVKKESFNLIDSVQVGGKELVAPGSSRLTLIATEGEFSVAGQRAKPAGESEPVETTAVCRELEVEEAGNVRAVIRAAGSFMAGEKKTLDFTARLYALAASPTVRVVMTVTNRAGKKFESFVGIQELSLSIGVKAAGDRVGYTFGSADGEDISGDLPNGPKAPPVGAVLLQLASDSFTVNGKSHPGGKDQNARRLGWASLRSDGAGLAAGVRNFWQLYPKGLEAQNNGQLKVLLVAPGETAMRPGGVKGVPMFTGGSRTHELALSFGPEAGRAQAMGVLDPLFAVAPTDWYCQKTWGFGRVYDSNLENFKPEHRELIDLFQKTLDQSVAGVLRWKDGKAQGIEEYGLFNYGSNVHHGSLVVKGSWIDTAWNGNYYDFPFAVLLNFARTGDWDSFELAQAHGLHLADIEVCHWHPTDQKLNGIEHVCYNIGQFRQFWRDQPFGVSGNADSTKNQSLYHLYYMTGDRRYLDVALLVSDYNAVHGGGALRARGNRMTGLYGSYEYTHDPKHLERWKDFVYKQGIALARSRGLAGWDQDWMYGLGGEGLMTYYLTTGDIEGAKATRTCTDSLIHTYWDKSKGATKSLHGFTLACFGYAYELTGDEEYLAKGLSQLKATAPSGHDRTKPFAQQYRISPQFFYYLAKDYKAPKPVLGDKDVFTVQTKPPAPPKPTVTGATGEFPATRDARITCHVSEQELNSGGGTILRVRNINSKSAELTVVDFDTSAMKAYLDDHAGEPVKAALVLKVAKLANGPTTLHVAALRSGEDWNEGTGTQAKPGKGVCSFVWARHDEARWKDAQGKEAEDLRATFYIRTEHKPRDIALLNSQAVAVETGASQVVVPLDEAIVRDLAANPDNRGLVLYLAQEVDGPQAILDISSRETRGGPMIRLSGPPTLPEPKISGNTAEFVAYRDARVMSHSSEREMNGGRSTRLRCKNINSNSGELPIMDFNGPAIRKFVQDHAGKTITATLELQVMELQNTPAELRVMALVSKTDWAEGAGNQSKAAPGEVCFAAARMGEARWTTADGKEVDDLRALLYDRDARKVLVIENAKPFPVKGDEKTLSVPLDMALVGDIALNENNRGLVLFIAGEVKEDKAMVDFRSREINRAAAVLKLTVQK